jgi:hypothetical protein
MANRRPKMVAALQLRERLLARGSHTDIEIDTAMTRAIARFAGAPIRECVPVLVERLVRDDLWRLTNSGEP